MSDLKTCKNIATIESIVELNHVPKLNDKPDKSYILFLNMDDKKCHGFFPEEDVDLLLDKYSLESHRLIPSYMKLAKYESIVGFENMIMPEEKARNTVLMNYIKRNQVSHNDLTFYLEHRGQEIKMLKTHSKSIDIFNDIKVLTESCKCDSKEKEQTYIKPSDGRIYLSRAPENIRTIDVKKILI